MKRLLVAAMLVLAGCGTGPAVDQNGHDYRLFVETLGGGMVSVVTTSSTAQVSLPGGFLTADGSNDPAIPLDTMVRHFDYLVEHLGIDRVGFGSDGRSVALGRGGADSRPCGHPGADRR